LFQKILLDFSAFSLAFVFDFSERGLRCVCDNERDDDFDE
jgi:hypothetical protein